MTKLSEYLSKVAYVFGCLLLCVYANGQILQKDYVLSVQPVDTTPAFIQKLRLQAHFPNAAACVQYAQQLPAMLAAKGYAPASADTIRQDSTGVFVKLFVGERYMWSSLYADEKTWKVLSNL